MKRPLSNSEHFLFTTGEDKDMHGIAFQSVIDVGLEDDDYVGVGGEKKRRLRVEQVRALEKSFEIDNKLDPERKVKLALELGLQPRQVAVWFQNRRARWKGKQLEHDYAALKASYDDLLIEFNCLQRDKDSLLSKIDKLKAKLAEDESQSFASVKHEHLSVETGTIAAVSKELPSLVYKDTGSTDSDSSAVLNDESSGHQFGSPADASHDMLLSAAVNMGFGLETACCSMLNCKMEDYEFIRGDEPCSSFFSDEQDPSLDCIDRWWYGGSLGAEEENVDDEN